MQLEARSQDVLSKAVRSICTSLHVSLPPAIYCWSIVFCGRVDLFPTSLRLGFRFELERSDLTPSSRHLLTHSINQSIKQSINQSINQTIKQSINQTINNQQSTNQ